MRKPILEKELIQEAEYRFPRHWLLRKAVLVSYLRKTELIAAMIAESSLSGGRGLDVGCGDGRGTSEIAKNLGPSFQLEGVDFSERAITFARLMAPHLSFNVQSGTELEFDDNTFSLVIAQEVVEHILPTEIPGFFAQLYRVLRPGGKIVITTPSVRHRLPKKHYQHFTAASLEAMLRNAHFTCDQVRGFGWWPRPWLDPFYRYVNALPSLWRIHRLLGTHEMPLARADGLLAIGTKATAA